MRKRILAFCTACIIAVSFCLYCVAPVRVSASGGGVTALYDLYQLYLLLMGISTSSSNSDYGFDDYWHDNFEHENYYEEWDSNLTDYEAGWYTIFDAIHLDDLVTSYDKLVASWDETYETVGSVGSFSGSYDLSYPLSLGSWSTDGTVYQFITDGSTRIYQQYNDTYNGLLRFNSACADIPLYFFSDGDYIYTAELLSTISSNYYLRHMYYYNFTSGSEIYQYFYTSNDYIDYGDYRCFKVAANSLLVEAYYHLFGGYFTAVDLPISDFISSLSSLSYGGVGSTFLGPVYSYPAAEQLAKDNNTSSSIRLAVDTDTGVADLNAVLDRTGCEDMDDVVAGVAAGSVPMSDVFDAAGVTPYILTDVDTGEIITDMDVSATAEGVKPVALTSDLSVPADLAAAEALTIPGRTYDPDTSKYKLPLFNFFPFCLPWDIYKVLSSFDADPVAPVIDIPLGKLFARVQGGDATASYVASVDLGEDQYAKWFTLLRSLECIGIIVGFVLLARALIHGGD